MGNRLPLQPVELDVHSVLRFRHNAIVRYLLENGPFDLNHLARLPFDQDDREQFAQLIGYSVCGYEELSCVSDESVEAARRAVEEFLAASSSTAAPEPPAPEFPPLRSLEELRAAVRTDFNVRTVVRDVIEHLIRLKARDL